MSSFLRLPAARLAAYRAGTYRLKVALRLDSPEAAVRWVNERGFVYFWPIQGVVLPSLWAAVAGDRPVADAHDDPGHVTWGWKDGLLGKKRWYYAKLLRGKATLVSLKTLPYFYALSDNYGEPAHDYALLYQEGRLTAEARAVFEALLGKGPLHTVGLRKEVRLASQAGSARFERALAELQTRLMILPVGVAQAGAWRYAFIYDVLDRHFPELAERARPIGRGEARAHLLDLYLRSTGAATLTQAVQLFRWKPAEAGQAAESLLKRRRARRASEVAGERGDWLVTGRLAE